MLPPAIDARSDLVVAGMAGAELDWLAQTLVPTDAPADAGLAEIAVQASLLHWAFQICASHQLPPTAAIGRACSLELARRQRMNLLAAWGTDPVRITDIPTDKLDELASLHQQLSPECLTGDGELPPDQCQPTQQRLTAALLALQSELALSQDEVDECAVYREIDRRREESRRGRLPRF